MIKTLGISLAVATVLSMSGCGSSSNDDGSTPPPSGEDTSFNSTTFIEDVDGVLSIQTTTVAKLKTFMNKFSIMSNAYAADIELESFKNFWNENVSTTENSDSLMGFIHQNVAPILDALETANWDYGKTGSGTMIVQMGSENVTIPYYSKPITVENGKGAKIYFGVDSEQDYENIDYKSDITVHELGDIVLTLKEINNVKTFYWVNMAKYADRDGEWQNTTINGKEFIKYKRKSDDSEYKYFPNVNRYENGASGGRTILFIVDENKKEIYFEHLTSTEKHNRQEHYTIRLTGLEDDNGKLRIGSTSKINFSRVAREYFNTTIDGQDINLVNDTNSSKVVYDIVQGSLTNGLKYAHSQNGILDNGCVEFTSDLDYNNISLSENCSSSITSLPTLTPNFETYKADPVSNIYLPSTGSTYDNIDLRVNMHSMYNNSYDGSWIAKLNVD